nr:PREDICTED: beta-crystallin S-like [Latimeria chalumnae]|eukprot:XP_006008573.1 PREDICTED: beta-crystallin S-like [Latimeria chalumnae]
MNMGKITFFEDPNFAGKKYESSVDCLDFHGFMSRCGSIRVDDGVWIIYEQPNYGGCMYILEKGEYPDFQHWKGHDNHVSSCRQIQPSSGKFRIQLYEFVDFGGQKIDVLEDCTNLFERWNRNEVNSLRVLEGNWVLYEEPNFSGRQYYVSPAEYRRCQSWGATLPRLLSLRRITM